MKVIVAGSRSIDDYNFITDTIKKSKFELTEIIQGGARGVDKQAKLYAKNNNIKCKEFPAKWEDFSEPCRKRKKYGREYNSLAGHKRNQKMANYADALIAIWDGKSPGTKDMIRRANKNNLKIFVYEVS